MNIRLSWLLLMLIYLSVNGQVAALPSHQSELANTHTSVSIYAESHDNHEATFLAKHSVHHQAKVQGISSSLEENNMTLSNCCQCDDNNDCSHANNVNINFLVALNAQLSITQFTEDPPVFRRVSYFKTTLMSNLYRPPITV
jgi:hypothetical protein